MDNTDPLSSKRSSLAGPILVLCTAVLWSTAGICVKLLPWSPLSISCARGLVSAITVLLLRMIRLPGQEKWRRFVWNKHTLLCATAMFATSMLFVVANKLTTAANAIVLQYIAPILILLYGIFIEKKRPSRLEILLTAVVFGGCTLAFVDQLGGGSLLGNVLALLSGGTFATQILLSRHPRTSPEDAQLLGCSMSFVLLLPFLCTDPTFVLNRQTLGVILVLGVFQYGLASFLFAKGIRRVEPVAASLILTIEPIFNPVWVFVFVGELPGPLALIGFVCVVGAVTLYTLLPLLRSRRTADMHERAPRGT